MSCWVIIQLFVLICTADTVFIYESTNSDNKPQTYYKYYKDKCMINSYIDGEEKSSKVVLDNDNYVLNTYSSVDCTGDPEQETLSSGSYGVNDDDDYNLDYLAWIFSGETKNCPHKDEKYIRRLYYSNVCTTIEGDSNYLSKNYAVSDAEDKFEVVKYENSDCSGKSSTNTEFQCDKCNGNEYSQCIAQPIVIMVIMAFVFLLL
ncbi:hypothetical protein QTN25_008833 [Entamoeba marina]